MTETAAAVEYSTLFDFVITFQNFLSSPASTYLSRLSIRPDRRSMRSTPHQPNSCSTQVHFTNMTRRSWGEAGALSQAATDACSDRQAYASRVAAK